MRLTAQPSIIINAEKGGYYLRRGTNYQVGQPIKTSIPGSTKLKTRYISNMYFNFKNNSITASFTNKPIKGLTELFNDK